MKSINCAVGESKEDWETMGRRGGRWLYSL